jgi:hypothetical protein
MFLSEHLCIFYPYSFKHLSSSICVTYSLTSSSVLF